MGSSINALNHETMPMMNVEDVPFDKLQYSIVKIDDNYAKVISSYIDGWYTTAGFVHGQTLFVVPESIMDRYNKEDVQYKYNVMYNSESAIFLPPNWPDLECEFYDREKNLLLYKGRLTHVDIEVSAQALDRDRNIHVDEPVYTADNGKKYWYVKVLHIKDHVDLVSMDNE